MTDTSKVSSDPVSGPATPAAAATPFGDEFATDSFKIRKKDLKRLHDSTRPLDSWERYRALVDSLEEAYDLVDIGNREARFALIVMGALNAMPLVFLTKTDAISGLSGNERFTMATLLSCYAILLLYFVLQAIEALHPGWFKPEIGDWSRDRADHPMGIRHFEEIIKRKPAEHWSAWQQVRLSQLNAELAVQIHSLARKNHAKHLAVRRLYIGLRAMALMLAAVLVLYGIFSWV